MDSPLTLYSLALSLAMVLSLGLAFMAFFRLKVPGALAFLFWKSGRVFIRLRFLDRDHSPDAAAGSDKSDG